MNKSKNIKIALAMVVSVLLLMSVGIALVGACTDEPTPTPCTNFQFLFGSGVPASSLGTNGDVYLNVLTSNLYNKVNGCWVFEVCIQGNGIKA